MESISRTPNFAAVTEAMGAKGIRIEDPDAVSDGLTEALAHEGGPVVVDVVVDPYALAMPSHVPFHAYERLHPQRCETSAKRQNGQYYKNGRTQYKIALTASRRNAGVARERALARLLARFCLDGKHDQLCEVFREGRIGSCAPDRTRPTAP